MLTVLSVIIHLNLRIRISVSKMQFNVYLIILFKLLIRKYFYS